MELNWICKSLTVLLILFFSKTIFAQVVKVEIKETSGKWELIRGGEPYYIKGVGGQDYLDEAVTMGANSIRTWSLENAKKYLDEAHKRGLTVMMGLWVQQERHGFDYNNEVAVKKQLDYFTQKVKELKDHPALLLWGVGNEVDLFYTNTKVWYAVQDIAKMIHEIDPNHPTCTVTAGLDSSEVSLIKERAPDIDIYGINTYGDLEKAVDKIATYGWDKPYIIAEWGPNGHWEVEKRFWGAPIEQNSSDKAASYKKRYAKIASDKTQCIGSYIFLWGAKQETTATWYGVFSERGERTQVIDVMHAFWQDKPAKNKSPIFHKYELSKNDTVVRDFLLVAGELYHLKVDFTDPDNDRIKYRYTILQESTDIKAGGDAESAPPAIPGLIRKRGRNQMSFKAPSQEGAYRIFIYADDRKNNVGYLNIPIYIKPSDKEPFIKLKKRELTIN